MAKAMSGLPLLLTLLVFAAAVSTTEAAWPYYGCYEFNFKSTIFFTLPAENSASLGCMNCKEQKVITPQEYTMLPHDLRKGSINNVTNNTPQECIKICNNTGYEYAGVQGGNMCVCSREHPHGMRSPYEKCNMPCSGDGNQTCGGNWKMNLYGNDEETFPFNQPGSNGTSRVSYLGCYSNTLDRLLTGTYDNSKTNSPIQCVDSCTEQGYAYAGLQYETQCICANEEPKDGAKQNETMCDYNCPGDRTSKCGGHWMMNVYQIAPKVNCTWSDWTWENCSKSCGGGNQNGTRTVAQPAKYGGRECEGSTTASQSCNSQECPVDCTWNEWSWGSCSASCGNATQSGTRTISQPAEHGGINCTGPSSDTRNCNLTDCPAPTNITKVIYTTNAEGTLRDNRGNITVQPGVRYTVSVEILRNDLGSSGERVQDITLDGSSIGGCNPDGGDYDCTFFNCPMPSATVMSQTGNVEVNMVFQGQSWDCDCDEQTWICSSENSVGGRTPVTAVGRFVLTPTEGDKSVLENGACNTNADCQGLLICDGNLKKCRKESAAGSYNPSFCSQSGRLCQLGEGDCDSDRECAGSLKCGVDNCNRPDQDSWAGAADCCYLADG